VPNLPWEHDGRSLLQLGTTTGGGFDGQETGASTPVQLMHVPPPGIQVPAKTQLEKPVKPVIVQ
jgi:hypothetical protein